MANAWNPVKLQHHLQAAVGLEFWTIPFYMAAMYSIEDPSANAYRLIQSVVYQEMLHVELAANIANAFGLSPSFGEPVYAGKNIPHLNFDLDTPNPTTEFSPYSAEIGPFDIERLNAMCLIEYPEWDTEREPDPKPKIEQYGSIGEFYAAVSAGAAAVVAQNPANLRARVHQVNLFQHFYSGFVQPPRHIVEWQPETETMIVTEGGVAGLSQVLRLMAVITSQGEGQVEGETAIPVDYQNTADDIQPEESHFTKFDGLLGIGFPATYPLKTYPTKDPKHKEQKAAQERLKRNFATFRAQLEQLFRTGELPHTFGVEMATLGGNILRCWQLGVVPTF